MARINQQLEPRERLEAAIWSQRMVKDAGLVVSASLLMAIAAHVSVPFGAVPFTLQPLAMLLIAFFLGGNRASAAMVVYLLEGASGLPVFSPAGPGGIAQLMGPTGGFLMATPFAAYAAGRLGEARKASFMLLGALAAEVILFTFGASWFSHVMHTNVAQTISLAVVPFLPGEVLKIVIATTIATLWKKRIA